MSKNSHYEKLIQQLSTIQSTPHIVQSLDNKLPNYGESPDYDNWVEGSLKFLRENENLFINKDISDV